MPTREFLEHICERERPMMIHYTLKRSIPIDDAETVVTNACLAFLRNFDPERSSPRTFLINCNRQAIGNYFSRKRVCGTQVSNKTKVALESVQFSQLTTEESDIVFEAKIPSFEDDVIARAMLDAALSVLTAKEQQALIGTISGFSYRESGGIIGVHHSHVGNLMRSARSKIADEFERNWFHA